MYGTYTEGNRRCPVNVNGTTQAVAEIMNGRAPRGLQLKLEKLPYDLYNVGAT